ncbi:MAG: uracil-DNA glycosylase [Armatimonadetes bacterium]|nr:uracil-DNA glycosylase [Armatimonadota bacterium]
MSSQILTIQQDIPTCERCPRLRQWCRSVAVDPPKRYRGETYWGKPVPPFGDPDAEFLIVGLAPAANGANRTGRMFTGDRSGDWLYRALHKAGVANQATSTSADDGLTLTNALIVAVCHCAPPDNKPTNEEIQICRPWLEGVVQSRTWTGVLCLGSIAWLQAHRAMSAKAPKFGHGVVSMVGSTRVVGSYHPSQQNTFTGRLTEPMLDAAVEKWLRG